MDADLDMLKLITKRGQKLLKDLSKHKDIMSWSRRRLRWFSAAHSFLGSVHMDLRDYDKARSHHQHDLKIGEQL